MILPYVRYEVEPTKTIPSGTVYRPLIPIRFIGPARSASAFGLLDTGADHVFVSAALADLLGVEPDSTVETALGAGGQEVDVRTASLEIEVEFGDQAFRWSTPVGILVNDYGLPSAYLGHAGFLEYFQATFDGDARAVELTPNQRLGHAT